MLYRRHKRETSDKIAIWQPSNKYLFFFTGGFLGDIALPDVKYETELNAKKINETLQRELERLKQEVFHEGLQVEEEGLPELFRKRAKQPGSVGPSRKINDPALTSRVREKNLVSVILL